MEFTRLLCNGMEQPLGYDFQHPCLTWVVTSPHRDDGQVAYRLEVALDPSFAETVYDSGRTVSQQTAQLPLPLDLLPCTRYYWRVTVWSRGEAAPATSPVTWFETARYALPWTGRFISSSFDLPQLRRRFTLPAPVRRARLYACGVGLYKMFLNGAPVSAEELAPGFCAYDCWLPYQTYDVTAQLRQGENILGAWLGNGYYKGRVSWPGMAERRCIYGDENALIAELSVELENGETLLIPTDERWESSASPFLRAEIYDGEVFDSRLWDRAWTLAPGTQEWQGVRYAKLDTARLQARKNLPVQVMGTFQPTLLHTPNGDWLLDFGQNASGRIRVRGQWPAGAEIRLQTGEVLDKDGNLYRENLRTALSEQVYISDGQPCDYAPTFTFFGFRYARVLGLEQVDPACFTMEVLYSAMEQTGEFSCSDPLVNRLFLNALWGQKSNFVDNPTDCPQRDERMGWTGDAQVFSSTACYVMDCSAFYDKYCRDMWKEQEIRGGSVPHVAPVIARPGGDFNIIREQGACGWADAAAIVPWNSYIYNGGKEKLREHYPAMKAWLEWVRGEDAATGSTRLWQAVKFHYGDWLALDGPRYGMDPETVWGGTDVTFLCSVYYYRCAQILAGAAKALGYSAEQQEYGQLAQEIKAAIQKEFFTATGRCAAATQTGLVLSLMYGLVPEGYEEKNRQALKSLLEGAEMHLKTGFLGTPVLCRALSKCGDSETAYTLLLQEDLPSWLYEVNMGATTVWERWNSILPDGSISGTGMNSLNHYAYGSIVDWMYRNLCGLNPVEEAPGFKKAVIRPMPDARLSWAKMKLDSAAGTYQVAWKYVDGQLHGSVTVPFDCQAQLLLPDGTQRELTAGTYVF